MAREECLNLVHITRSSRPCAVPVKYGADRWASYLKRRFLQYALLPVATQAVYNARTVIRGRELWLLKQKERANHGRWLFY